MLLAPFEIHEQVYIDLYIYIYLLREHVIIINKEINQRTDKLKHDVAIFKMLKDQLEDKGLQKISHCRVSGKN